MAWAAANRRAARCCAYDRERARRSAATSFSQLVSSLGHAVVAESTDVTTVASPDVALVGLGESAKHALELIDRIVTEASCPVITLLDGRDQGFVNEAARRGVFAYIVDKAVKSWRARSSRPRALPRISRSARRFRAQRPHRARQRRRDGAQPDAIPGRLAEPETCAPPHPQAHRCCRRDPRPPPPPCGRRYGRGREFARSTSVSIQMHRAPTPTKVEGTVQLPR